MLSSMVDSSRCARVKKRVYMPQVADEYNSSSQPLNAVVLASILSMMSPSYASKKLRQGYMVDLAREGGVSPCALMLGLLYIKRLSKTNPDYISLISPRDLFLVSMVVASKYMNDEGEMEALTNSDWAKLGSMAKTTLDELERNFLRAIDWKLYVPLEEYYTFVNSIEARIALEQASRRGWFSYTDLTAIWDATDLQYSMMLATKQTAKVATKGAALYLMCVATLFAASGTLPLTLDPTTGLQLSTTTTAVGSPSPQASSYLGHAPSPAQSHQQMPVGVHHNALPDFEQMETLHRKKDPDPPVEHSSVASNDSQHPRSLPCGGLHTNGSTTSPCTGYIVVGGWNQMVVTDKGKDLVSDFGTEHKSNDSNFSSQDGVASPTSTSTMDSLDSNGMIKKTWTKFEDGLVLLLNLMASICLSPSTSLPSHASGDPLSHTPGSPESPESRQPSTSETSRSSTPPHAQNGMDSETTGLSTVQLLLEHPSCHDCQQKNSTVHWWDGSNDATFGTFLKLVESAGAVNVTGTSHHVHRNPHLDFRGSWRGKHNTTVHCSRGKAVTVDTTATTNAMCVCTSRYSESEIVASSPKLNTGQLAVDLHWQSGGTGDTDHAFEFSHRFNSTPLDLVMQDLNMVKFTLTENLLLYANRLLTMAF